MSLWLQMQTSRSLRCIGLWPITLYVGVRGKSTPCWPEGYYIYIGRGNFQKGTSWSLKSRYISVWSHHQLLFEWQWALWRSPLLTEKHLKRHWQATAQYFRENVLWTDETKLELFGKSHQLCVHRWKNKAFRENKTVPTVKHAGSSILFWGSFPASGTACPEFVECTIKLTIKEL